MKNYWFDITVGTGFLLLVGREGTTGAERQEQEEEERGEDTTSTARASRQKTTR